MTASAPSNAWKTAVLDQSPTTEALKGIECEEATYDAVIAGAGPAGLAAAIRLEPRARANGCEISVAVLE